MSRPGVDYDTVKRTINTLLARGEAPSVQRIRHELGTGSNSTIAAHLRVWREQQAKKTTPVLPSTIPESVVSAMEVFWQTAAEQAENQLAHLRNALNEQSEQLEQEKLTIQTNAHEVKHSLEKANATIAEQHDQIAHLKTELAVHQEQIQQKETILTDFKTEAGSRLARAYKEKDDAIAIIEKEAQEMKQLQQKLTEQHQQYQTQLEKERVLQQQSEIRWANLIDQARTETQAEKKNQTQLQQQLNQRLEKLQNILTESQQAVASQSSEIRQQQNTINELKQQLSERNQQYQDTMRQIATLEAQQLMGRKKLKSGLQKRLIKRKSVAD